MGEKQADSETEIEDIDDDAPAAPFDPTANPVRFTHLKQMARSPAHYLHSARVGMEDTDKKRFGRGAHVLCLGGELAVFDGDRRAGKKWEEFKAANQGIELVTRKEHAAAARIAQLVRTHPIAGPLLLGKTEHQVDWEYLGRKCTSRLDSLNPPLLTELKSTTNGEPGWFQRNALRLGYHAQLAFYRMACRSLGIEITDVHIVAIEMKAPHPITVLRLTERALTDGEKLCRIWMEQVLNCERSNAWPPYVQSVVDFDSYEGVELVFGDEEAA